MAIQANTLPPSLVNELADLKRRLDNLERSPAPVNSFDRYPTSEWEPIPRGTVDRNMWHSLSIADVTGMVFDRVETRFVTYDVITGKREPEIRLAAFRVTRDGEKQIVSASQSWQLQGWTSSYLVPATIRWIHGIPHGWNYANDVDVYTIELQIRYAVGPQQNPPPGDTGNAKLSAMQYCVGLPANRAPDATPEGELYYDFDWKVARSPSLTEEVMSI